MIRKALSIACLASIAGASFASGALNNYYAATQLGSTANLQPGVGFSTATQQITADVCYATGTPTYSAAGELSFSDAQSFSKLEKQINVNVSEGVGIGLFSESAAAQYMRSIKDTSASMSVNYAQTIVQHVSFPITGLNTTGTTIYENDANKKPLSPNFDLLCGNHYVTGYDRGAMLLAAFNIHFATEQEKQTFQAHIGASFGGFASAAASISEIAKQYNLSGTVNVKALQIGGTPNDLAQIMNNGESVTQCSITDMTACQKTAQDIVNYAANNFSKQITVNNNQINGTYSPLPLDVASDTASIENLGITKLPTVITSGITEDRQALANMLDENEYYHHHLYALKNQYPVAWDQTSTTYKDIASLESQAENNINIIEDNPQNVEDSAMQCYNSPILCPQITQAIESEVKPITLSELGFMSDSYNSIQYMYDYFGYYYNGTTYVPTKLSGSRPYVISPISFSATPTNLQFSVHENQRNGAVFSFDGNSSDNTNDSKTYVGNAWTSWWSDNDEHVHRLISPYYFSAYQS